MKRLEDFSLTPALRDEINSVIINRRLPHAVVIASGDYMSRIEFALFLSAAYLCSEDNAPCGECKNCKKIANSIHPDVQLFEREKDKKEFSVKIIRDFIKNDAFIKPNEADGKVFIIKDAESMNINAQNAMLKIFEEPPVGVKFILCCDSVTSLLETIRSRATAYSLLSEPEITADDERAVELAVKLALSLLSFNEYEFMSETGIFEKDKDIFKAVLGNIQILFRDALAVKNDVVPLSGNMECSLKLASAFGTEKLIRLISSCDELSEAINKNANLNLLLTRFSSVLRQAARG